MSKIKVRDIAMKYSKAITQMPVGCLVLSYQGITKHNQYRLWKREWRMQQLYVQGQGPPS